MAENFIDYYAIMGLTLHSTDKDVEETYKRLWAENMDNENSKKMLLQAYQLLRDKKKRGIYNETYSKAQINGQIGNENTAEEWGINPLGVMQPEDLDTMIASTHNYFSEFKNFVNDRINQTEADLSYKGNTADRAEDLYRHGMWPLLGKIKDVAGENSFAYTAACELHAMAVFSLGDLFMWAERYERALGMYNTALALSGKNTELTEKCSKALAFTRDVIEQVKTKAGIAAKGKTDEPEAVKVFSYLEVVKWIMVGVLFGMFCLVGVIWMLEYMFNS